MIRCFTISAWIVPVTAVLCLFSAAHARLDLFKCEDEVCKDNIISVSQRVYQAVLYNSTNADDTVGIVDGPALLSLRKVNKKCNCSIKAPSIGLQIECQNAQQYFGKSIPFPEGKTTLSISGQGKGCFMMFDFAPSMDKMITEVGGQIGMSEESILKFMAQMEAKRDEAKRRLTVADCDPRAHTVQVQLVRQLPAVNDNTSTMQLLLSNLRSMFGTLTVGVSTFPAKSDCYAEPMKRGLFDKVYKDIDLAIKSDADGDESPAAPLLSPLSAVHRAFSGDGWELSDKIVTKIVVLDTATGPTDHAGGSCVQVEDGKILEELSHDGNILVVVGDTHTIAEYRAFKEKHNLTSVYTYSLDSRPMTPIDQLADRIERDILECCGRQCPENLLDVNRAS